MVMRFRGGGVGHKSTRNATDQFLDDRDRVEKGYACQQDELGSHEEDHQESALDGGQGCDKMREDENQVDHGDELNLRLEEELDYGYGNDPTVDDEDAGWMDDDEDLEFLIDDILGAEDGEGAYDDTEDLGFADL
jgi:hypothetical protein